MFFRSHLDPRFGRHLGLKLRAMRHLPPGTHFARPVLTYQHALMDDLLHLSDDVDPLCWLQQHRGDEIARHALWIVLDLLIREYPGVGRSHPPRQGLPAPLQALVDDIEQAWLPAALIADPFVGLAEGAEPAVLTEILQRVRAVRPRYAGPGGFVPNGDLPSLVDELLRLSPNVD